MQVRLRYGAGSWLASGGYLVLLFVGFQVDSPAAWRWIAMAIAALALVAWVLTLRRARAVADTPTSRIASAAQGYVELIGRGASLDGTPVLAPLRHVPCLWYRYKVERKQDDKWVTESSGESNDSFWVDDGTGRCVVDPEGAEVLPSASETWYAGDYRYTEAMMIAGERVYVLGAFRTLGGDSMALDAGEDIKQLLAEWKKDMPKLLERFDLDGEGTLDMREWQLARSQARREVQRNHREMRAAPDTHMMGKPADDRLFLISTLPPEKLQRHFTRWAVAHVTIFLAALIGVALIRSA